MPGPTLYIVDGYNVLHALIPGLAQADLADRRQWLVDHLASLAGARAARVLLVFDAPSTRATACEQVGKTGLEVCFASGRQGADALIARRIAGRPADVHVVVVSADQEVQRTASRAGVSRMTPAELGRAMNISAKELAFSSDPYTMRTRIEDEVDLETWRRLEELRTDTD